MFDFVPDKSTQARAERFNAHVIERLEAAMKDVDDSTMATAKQIADASVQLVEIVKPAIRSLRFLGNPELAHRYQRYCDFVLSQCEERENKGA